jgi:RNA polymerase sigma factor (sigma-70 family)
MAMRTDDDIYDEWLVLRAQSDDAAALKELFDRWQPRLMRLARRLTDTIDGAADVTQLAWVAIIGGLSRLSDPACFRRWAYRIVTNKAADFVRARQQDRVRMKSLSAESCPRQTGETNSVEQDDIFLLYEAIGQLSMEHRSILLLFYIEELPLTEIAEIVNVPLGTVKSRLHYAKSKLLLKLERDQR